jgi:hypothetical protein
MKPSNAPFKTADTYIMRIITKTMIMANTSDISGKLGHNALLAKTQINALSVLSVDFKQCPKHVSDYAKKIY